MYSRADKVEQLEQQFQEEEDSAPPPKPISDHHTSVASSARVSATEEAKVGRDIAFPRGDLREEDFDLSEVTEK